MKKLILVLCFVLTGYGCEKAEPKVLKLLSDDYYAYTSRLQDARQVVSDMKLENIRLAIKNIPYSLTGLPLNLTLMVCTIQK